MNPPSPSVPCAVCAGREYRFLAEKNACQVWRCAGCGLAIVHPAPSPDNIHKLYDDAYAGATTGYFTKPVSKMRRSRRRVRRLARRLPGGAAGRRFLDIGCNGGFMTEAAREAGFAATGLDPDRFAIAWAREHFPRNDYLHGLLEEADFGGRRFDAVYCSEVIEHVPDTNRFVGALAAALAPNGLVYLTTPDIDHWRRTRDIMQWEAFNPPSHCVYFNPSNLKRLLGNHRLSVIWRAVSFKPGIKLIARKEA